MKRLSILSSAAIVSVCSSIALAQEVKHVEAPQSSSVNAATISRALAVENHSGQSTASSDATKMHSDTTKHSDKKTSTNSNKWQDHDTVVHQHHSDHNKKDDKEVMKKHADNNKHHTKHNKASHNKKDKK